MAFYFVIFHLSIQIILFFAISFTSKENKYNNFDLNVSSMRNHPCLPFSTGPEETELVGPYPNKFVADLDALSFLV